MRLVAAFALVAALFVCPAVADDVAPLPSTPVNSASNGSVFYAAPIANSSGQMVRTGQSYSSSQNVFGRLIELERRKNAWLRQRFLGR